MKKRSLLMDFLNSKTTKTLYFVTQNVSTKTTRFVGSLGFPGDPTNLRVFWTDKWLFWRPRNYLLIGIRNLGSPPVTAKHGDPCRAQGKIKWSILHETRKTASCAVSRTAGDPGASLRCVFTCAGQWREDTMADDHYKVSPFCTGNRVSGPATRRPSSR
jgi:hypothetical protein